MTWYDITNIFREEGEAYLYLVIPNDEQEDKVAEKSNEVVMMTITNNKNNIYDESEEDEG